MQDTAFTLVDAHGRKYLTASERTRFLAAVHEATKSEMISVYDATSEVIWASWEGVAASTCSLRPNTETGGAPGNSP